MSKDSLSLHIINARENNLKNVDVELPHDSFITVTGLSGSGKSSLAFDTVYAEGQRRYIETFSPYTRQFFDKVKKPTVDAIENVRPAVAIQQRTRILNSRSTVGTMTDINDYLKIIWSNLSLPVCGVCGIDFITWDKKKLSELLKTWCENKIHSSFLICSEITLPATKKGFTENIERIKAEGYSRYFDKTSGETKNLDDDPIPFQKNSGAHLFVITRCKNGSFDKRTVEEGIEEAYLLGKGRLTVIEITGKKAPLRPFHTSNGQSYRPHVFSREFGCPENPKPLERPRPSLFSFNHPIGACPECKGFGKILVVDEEKIIPDKSKTLEDGAISCWTGEKATWERKHLYSFCKEEGIPVNIPWRELEPAHKKLLYEHESKRYYGLNAWFAWLETKRYKMHVRVFLARYRTQADCPSCNGTRLKQDALAYKILGKNIHEICLMPISDLSVWFKNIQEQSLPRQVKDVLQNVLSRINFLEQLGLGYLTLDRQARTLSGGETQRVNLVTALGSNLTGTHFVLDEPSVGLHARDTERLVKALRELHKKGNSLLVVEHDPDCISAGDLVLELGPEAGATGGQVTYLGTAAKWGGLKNKPFRLSNTTIDKKYVLQIKNAIVRNITGLSLNIPLNAFVCLTGVSGSGKSSLAHEIIKNGFEVFKGVKDKSLDASYEITGYESLEDIVFIDQSALAKTPRANIATYTKIWDDIREYLSETEAAKSRALTKSSFSFNVNAGRCTTCEGAGFIREDMQFLSDVFVPCEDCGGKRFQDAVLHVNYKGKNVDDFLRMSVGEAAQFFTHNKKVAEAATLLTKLGLGHLTLGHSLSELSGGEAQRLKLVPFIQSASESKSLLIFDEPTTGLHMKDVENLLEVFALLRERGHSILCIEHNLRLIADADWIVELGPEGGALGGQLVQEGTPKDFADRPISYTGKYLKEFVQQYGNGKNNVRNTGKIEFSKKDLAPKELIIKGAREHNLKDIDLKIPFNKLVTLTGVSGSGKSSIAKDIIYSEGQRRYLDCLSPYARQFIKELKKPDIDDIKNLKPTICVYQHTFQPSALSTVGTMSEAYNFLRLLFAKVGVQYCPDHPTEAISALPPEMIAEKIKAEMKGPIRILAPIIKLKKGTHKAVFERAIASEINEVRVDGLHFPPSRAASGLEKSKAHTIEFVVAKFNVDSVKADFIEEGVSQALLLGSGTLVVLGNHGETVFSAERTCPVCKRGFFKPDPEDLSFSSRRGRCEKCSGLGVTSKGETCSVCSGSRLNALGRNIKIAGQSIFELASLLPGELFTLLKKINWKKEEQLIVQPVIRELEAKLKTLSHLGLEHIPLSRDCKTLSGGELQRLRLGTAMGSPLTGVLYIFDEPSAGLHPLDNLKVLDKLKELRDSGNSVIQIEHEADSILASDHIIEVGPGAGRFGGEIVFSGDMKEFGKSSASITAQSIFHPEIPETQGKKTEHTLQITSGNANTIQNLSIKIPLKQLVTVAGVSGAGKSSLVHGIIVETVLNGKGDKASWTTKAAKIKSDIDIERLLVVDQKPIGINSRSTPVSYLGIWDHIRSLYALVPEAASRGWTKSFFSYNSGKGRCQMCKGMGEITLEMSFLANAKVPCDLCGGSRFTDEANSIKYLGTSISEVLKLTFEEAKSLFINHKKIHRALRTACDLGLGYLTIGQSSTTLSGGESQRIKLTAELNLDRHEHTLYVLDEPTTGLHKVDVQKLLKALRALVTKGHSVIVIEHDRDMLLASDYVIELGPGAGEKGGKVVFADRPGKLFQAKTAWGEVLKNDVPSLPLTGNQRG